jgi:hypothetical protein
MSTGTEYYEFAKKYQNIYANDYIYIYIYIRKIINFYIRFTHKQLHTLVPINVMY